MFSDADDTLSEGLTYVTYFQFHLIMCIAGMSVLNKYVFDLFFGVISNTWV